MENLAQRVHHQLAGAKTYTALGVELWPILPDARLHHLECVKAIQAFAAKNGWTATILDPGISVTFRKRAVV